MVAIQFDHKYSEHMNIHCTYIVHTFYGCIPNGISYGRCNII